MDLYSETLQILKKYNVFANKSLGQNFLISEEIVNNIIEKAEVSKEDLVIEIGPGLGTLTKELLRNAGKVICIELDKRMISILEDRFSNENLCIINDDVLKVNLNELIQREKVGNISRVKVVANLPYYITTPIIMKLLEEKLDIESITVMVQKEVADRLIATPGEKLSGAITYCVYYYASSESITIVENNSFIPEPEVDSEVIKLSIRKDPPVNVLDEKMFFKIIKASFMQRRKTLLNALVKGGILPNKDSAKKVFENLNFNYNIRGEALSINQFAEISNYIVKNKIQD